MTTPEFKPRRIAGSWRTGFALDLHSTGSDLIGHDEFGHPQFQTHRTQIGELLYRLKYRGDLDAVAPLVEAALEFLGTWEIRPTVIVPVPPTNTNRRIQPVTLVANGIGARLGTPVVENAVRRTKVYSELKNIADPDERRQRLAGAFSIDAVRVRGARILLFDDLYRSGATMNAIGAALTDAGAAEVMALALTQTRSRQ